MLEALSAVILILMILSWLSLILGLIRPVYVLWFLDSFHRLKVIQIYGSVGLALTVFYLGIRCFS